MDQRAQEKEAIWLDCDPGHDDAMAIILASFSERLLLLGISTVAGNQSVDKTTANAVKILKSSGINNVKVVKGAAKPLMRPEMFCPEIHGESGLDSDTRLSSPSQSSANTEDMNEYLIHQKAIFHIYNTIHNYTSSSSSRSVTVVATGSLTNIALLLLVFPEIQSDIKQIVLMGGCMGAGNTSPVAEFNIQTDPEAAKIVFESGFHIVQVPLEVTHSVLVTREYIDEILSLSSAFSHFITDLLLFFKKTYNEVFHFSDPPLHDPVAVAYVIDPSLFEGKLMRVDVETVSPLSAGQTVCDIWSKSEKEKNVFVTTKVDVKGFWKLMMGAIREANMFSPLNRRN